MKTPICDFVDKYISSGISRLHVPGHKGASFLGCEDRDITEVFGADVLGEAEGIIAESETIAAGLFGTYRTFYSTEGSSHVIRAMLMLAAQCFPRHGNGRPFTVLAARNVHKSFIHACGLLDLDIEWLYPDEDSGFDSICSCPITALQLEAVLSGHCGNLPDAVYITSPDYLGTVSDIRGLSDVCARFGLPLLVDNAHGAYLHFLKEPAHPIDLGAVMCCDSAHKTLPVLTGGAYLHIAAHPACCSGKAAKGSVCPDPELPAHLAAGARHALSVFGSTSPSYLILQSLDLCNHYLSDGYKNRLDETIRSVNDLKKQLAAPGFFCLPSEPLKLVLSCADAGLAAAHLRRYQVECEFTDRDYVVLMFTPENTEKDYARILAALENLSANGNINARQSTARWIRLPRLAKACSIREALLSPSEMISSKSAFGRICAVPTVSCPPAVPIAVSGERFDEKALDLLELYGIREVSVLKEG